MEYRPLGTSELKVSLICLGTMNFGEQVDERGAHEQMDYALDRGVNFFDTAEMYAVPPKRETQGSTERIIGTWFQKRKNRDKVILATKVAGRGRMDWLRPGGERTRLDRKSITYAVEQSLKRLQTDYIDLYQLHWPDRPLHLFNQTSTLYQHIPSDDAVPPEETLGVLREFVEAGKIRHVGLSNETPWGVHAFLKAAEQKELSRVQSIQNAYNLLNRTFESGLSEFALREKVGLLAYSPLGQGFLTGKYLYGRLPKGSRKQLFERQQRYESPQSENAVARYVALAHSRGLDPAQLALAFVNSRPFVTSNIIGATTLAQLETDVGSIDVRLDEEVLDALDRIHREIPNPAP